MKLPLSAVLVLAVYVVAITAFGTWLGRRGRSVKDYFLGGRSVPWWAIAACIVATETSTLTFIGAPGTAYNGNWTFLQLVIGYVIGRLVVAWLFIPAYFRGDLYTSYELLQRRFGGAVRGTSAAIFLMYRTLGDGIRLHAAALVLSVAAGVAEWWCILLLGAAMILYTEEGGVTATIWTDTIQMFVYLAGAIVCLVAVIQLLPDGVAGAMAAARAAGKLQVIDLSFDLTRPFTLWAGVIGGAFLTLATHGTDHYLVQRLLVAKSRRDAAIGLTVSGFLVMAQFALFLFLGTLFWAHYGGRPFARGDEVLPTFVSTELAGPLVGFILAAVVAAALVAVAELDGVHDRPRLLPAVLPAGRDRRPADTSRQGLHGDLGRAADGGGGGGAGHRLRAAGRARRPQLRVGSHRRRVPPRRPHPGGELGGDDDGDGGGAGGQPLRGPPGPGRVRLARRGLDLERGHRLTGHRRRGPRGQPPASR